MTERVVRGGVRGWLWAARGAARVAGGLARGRVLAGGLGQLVEAQGHGRLRDRPALITPHARLTWAQLAERVASERATLRGGRLVVHAEDPVEIAVRTLAGLGAGVHVRMVPPRAGERVWRESQEWERRPAMPGEGRLTLLTSGTTATPKPVSHGAPLMAGVMALSLAGAIPLGRGVVAGLAPLDGGHGLATFVSSLATGGTFLALSGTLDERVRLLRAHDVDVVTGVPAQLADVLERTRGRVARVVLSGSDRLPPELAERWRARGMRVFDAYGSTETATVAIGERVLMPAAGVIVRQWGQGLAITSPLCHEPIVLDRGRIERGGFVVLGRADGAHVSGGEVTNPEALRVWLLAQPAVTGAAVTTVPDVRFGSRYAARVMLPEGDDLPEDQWRERIRADLGPALVPVRIVRA